MRIFLDTSALAKRYIEEPGTAVVLNHCARATEIVISTICTIELFSTLNRSKREKKITLSQYLKLKPEVATDLEHVTIIDLSPAVISGAITFIERVPLATLDAIHIASSKEAQCDLFLTADRRQYEAAKHLQIKSEYIN